MATLQYFFILIFIGLAMGRNLAPELANEVDDNDDAWMHNQPVTRLSGFDDVKYEGAEYWLDLGQSALAEKLQVSHVIEKEAVNTIFFLGDGMSLPTVTAARIFKGQSAGQLGEESSLFFESFPHTGLSKTFCSDSQVADSACSATAYLCGTKANVKTIGVKPSVKLDDCAAMMDVNQQVQSVLAWAQAAGKSTGVITTTRITHASPAGTYAHVANRDWESDNDVTSSNQNSDLCDDIAEQLIYESPGQKINVILGGGRGEFLPNTVIDPESGKRGKREDGQNLIEIWQQLKFQQGANFAYVDTREKFESVDAENVDYLFGLFNYDHLNFATDSTEDPSLPEMVKKGIEILSKNPNGYFLFVEGGRIDHAHHGSNAMRALVETVFFDQAVETAANMTSDQDTLILVTADHAHTMSISGYADRGNPILGIAGVSSKDYFPYTTISYANGPGYKKPGVDCARYDISDDDIFDKAYKQPTTLPLSSETHGGDDVGIFARGPFSHLLTGVMLQSYIPHVIGYASCTGAGLNYCKSKAKRE